MRRSLAPPLLLLATTACGLNTGFLHDPTSDQTVRYQMNIASERYARSVVGSSSAPAILCVLPIEGTLYYRAMQELNARANLQSNEHLAHIRTDDDLACFILFGNRSLTISADVYEVIPGGVAATAPPSAPPVVTASTAPPPPPPPHPPPPPPPPDPAQHECLDDNSCRIGYHCVFVSGASGGICRPQTLRP